MKEVSTERGAPVVSSVGGRANGREDPEAHTDSVASVASSSPKTPPSYFGVGGPGASEETESELLGGGRGGGSVEAHAGSEGETAGEVELRPPDRRAGGGWEHPDGVDTEALLRGGSAPADRERSAVGLGVERGERGGVGGGDGLAVARAVSPDQDERALPRAVDYDPEAKRRQEERRRYYRFCSIVVCLIVVMAVGVAVPVAIQKNKEKEVVLVRDTPEAGPTESPTPKPTAPTVREQLEALVGDKIHQQGTAHQKAFKWLTEEDAAGLGRDSPNLIQRFLLSFLSFTFHAENWTYCAPSGMVSDVQCDGIMMDDDGNAINVTNSSRWLSSDHECKWFGIVCLLGNKASRIELWNNSLQGTIPSELAKFPALQVISFIRNSLSGTIPTELGSMPDLIDIEVGRNHLTGSLPEELYDLTNLNRLNVMKNNLTGTLSPRLGSLTKLVGLFTLDNMFTGPVPSEIGNLRSLVSANLNRNQHTGSIPKEVGNCVQLQELRLHDNNFTGTIPEEIGGLANIFMLHLQSNGFSGELPRSIGNLSYLEVFNINSNQLSGMLPDDFYYLENLYQFDCSYNNFTGSIPGAIENLFYLEELKMNNNMFSGKLLDEFYSLENLYQFDCSYNKLSGTISTMIRRLVNLTTFLIEHNLFGGTIPSELADLESIEVVRVHYNGFTGTISDRFCNLYEDPFSLHSFYADCGRSNMTAPPAVECSCCTDCCDTVRETCMSVYDSGRLA